MEFEIFQSTHPVRGGTAADHEARLCEIISIHPPRAGWDPDFPPGAAAVGYFNPPTPCGVGPAADVAPVVRCKFQSTHPVRGGTGRARPHHQM